MTEDQMRELVNRHRDREMHLDVEGTLATLAPNPTYEFYPARLKLEGMENHRAFHRELFHSFFPLIQSSTLINEWWGSHTACMEYDMYLKAPHPTNQAYRIMVVLTAKDSLILGERVYAEEGIVRLMMGNSVNKFIRF